MMKVFLFFITFWSLIFIPSVFAQNTSSDVAGDSPVNISDQYLNVRGTSVGSTGVKNNQLVSFASSEGVKDFFMIPHMSGGDSILNVFITIAFGIKNFFIIVAGIFLMIGVLKLLFSGADEEDIKKWKNNIIWVSVGVFVMQIAFSAWNAFLQVDVSSTVNGSLGWTIWTTVVSPIVNILQFLAGGAFLLMAIYAFYIIVTGGGDEEKLKKGKNMVMYGLIGFLLIRIPRAVIEAFYGNVNCPDGVVWTMGQQCDLVEQSDVNLGLQIFGKVLEFFNGFLMLVCVLLVIYAGWLVLISAGDEEKLKKAKNTVIYILIGFIILIASHAIFRFFIMQ